MKITPRIVADSLRRIRRSKEYSAARKRFLSEARERRAKEIAAASFWGRIRIHLVIDREVRNRLAKMFPPSALYVAGSQ